MMTDGILQADELRVARATGSDAAWQPDAGTLADPSTPRGNGTGLAGRTFADYELLEEIARGGMGVVYKARQRSLNRTVAVKMILAGHLASLADHERFHAEAEAAANLDHPGIVPVFQVGEQEGQHFYSMGFVDGQTLTKRLEQGPVAPREAALLARDVAEAVQYAHSQGVVHRDLKPGNILLDRAGRPRVADFGLAKRAASETHLTMTGQVLGTPSFMPPEQARGQTDEIGPSADIYALGAVLYAMLTGRPPFQAATSLETLNQVLTRDPVPPRQLNAQVPPDLETIVLKCLEKSPARRYRSGQELSDELGRFLDGQPILARPIGRLERLHRTCRRNPVTAAVITMAALGVVLVAVGSTVAAMYLRHLLAVSEAHRQRKEVAERDASYKLWESYLSQAQALRVSKRPGRRFTALRALGEASRLPVPPNRSLDELRNEAIACLLLSDLEVARQWSGFPPGTKSVGFDGTFTKYARQHVDNGEVSVHRVSDDRELYRLPGQGPANEYYRPELSEDGRFLEQWCAVQGEWRGRLWRVDGPQPILVQKAEHRAFAFSPDGRRAAADFGDGSLRIIELATGRELQRFDCGLDWSLFLPRPLSWHPHLPRLLAATRDEIAIFDVDQGARVDMVPVPAGQVSCCLWHPNGRVVVVTGRNGRIYLWDTVNRRSVLPALEGGNGGGLIAQFDRQGDHLLTTDWTSLWKLWDLRTGQQLLSLPAAGTCLQFHAQGDQIAADAGVSTHVRLLRYRPGNEMQSLVHWSYEPLEGVPQPKRRGGKPHEPYPLPVPFERHTLATIDPQGRLLAVGTENGTALVNLTRWEEVGLLPLPRHNPLAFAGDGSLWTYGPTGIHRWPAPQDTSGDHLQFGPPELLFSCSNIEWHGISADGATIAIPNYREGALVWSQANQQHVRLPAGGDVRSCAVSPDGRWVATGAHGLSTVKVAGARIWDARSGKHLRDLAVQPFCGVWFSPDGSWLATLVPGQECQLWKSGSWEPGPRLPYVGFDRRAVFARDGSLLALQGEPGTLRLIQPETGVELARLITSEDLPLVPLCFTPDGSQLIAMGYEGQSLHRFDLRAIQAGLTELRLDWQLPPFSDLASPVRLSSP